MKVYKGTDRNIRCRGYQFTPGVAAEEDAAILCERGFHACEAPLDVLSYYAPGEGSRYFEADLDGVSPQRHPADTKVCGKKITLGVELGIPGLVKAQIEYVKAHTTTEYTDPKQATAGYKGAATSRGASATGKYGLSVARTCYGNARVKGGLGALLVIANEDFWTNEITDWKAVVVDGETVKADTWYKLVDGELIEVEE